MKIKLKNIFFHFFISFLFLFCSENSFSQNEIKIKGQFINNTRFSKIVIQKFGVGIIDIAAVPIDKETGKFVIDAPQDVEPGIYRLRYSQTGFNEFVDVIINGNEKNIDFVLDLNEPIENRMPLFKMSDENFYWYTFYKGQLDLLNKIKLKEQFLINYIDKKEDIYLVVFEDYIKSIKLYLHNRESFINKSSFYWAKYLAHYTNLFFPDIKDHWKLQLFNEHDAFWNGKITNEVSLINTPLYTEAILDYIQFYLNPKLEFNEEELKQGYVKSVDKIIEVFGSNEKTKLFAINYLQKGFKEIGNEELLKYIDETYAVKFQCTAEDSDLQKRLKGYETLKIGNYAPEIIVTDNEGKTKVLKDFPQEKVVLVFWASWCPHCIEEMPKLQEWAKSQKNTVVLAVSLDDDYAAFQDAVKKFPNMLHYCDLQKWNGKIVSDYFVAATPTFFVLDKERKIAGKYSGFEELILNK